MGIEQLRHRGDVDVDGAVGLAGDHGLARHLCCGFSASSFLLIAQLPQVGHAAMVALFWATSQKPDSPFMVKVLLDIDGVLNPFLADASKLPASFEKVQEGWVSWLLDYDKHRDYLLALELESEIIWASSWEEESNLVNKHLGLGCAEYPYVLFENMPGGKGTWKLPSIQHYLDASDEPVVWLDDEFEDDARSWAARRPNTLLIECDPREGWTQPQYEQVLEFVRAHPQKEAAEALHPEPSTGRLNPLRFLRKGSRS